MNFTSSDDEGVRMPILLIGYCRPIEFKRIADQIELLPSRYIKISLDGPKSDNQLLTDEVLSIAHRWKEVSRHEIEISKSVVNLGLLTHFTTALDSFYGENEFGLILEDDMEFRSEFVEYLDTDSAKTALSKYWSICGHNPLEKYDLSCKKQSENVDFFETSVHTIWGWAASRSSICYFLDFVKMNSRNSNFLFDVVSKFSTCLTRDLVFRNSINSNWFGKIRRSTNSEMPNWDNYWLLAGWSSGKESIMPQFSLSREDPLFFGVQTHIHPTKGESWNSVPNFSVSDFIVGKSLRRERSLVAVWGNSRFKAYKELVRRSLIWRS